MSEIVEKSAVKKTKSFLNKIVIRKLPPNLTADSFLEIVSPYDFEVNNFYFQPSDLTLGAASTSRAYIEFRKEEDVFIFKEKFDEYVFVDSNCEYPAIVEYAPFQGIPKSRGRKKDKNVGSIEEADHFKNFIEQLRKEEEDDLTNSRTVTYSYQLKDDKKITSTPLIEFLATKNQERKEAKRKKQEEKRKQRDEEKQKKKVQVAKNIPESIKEEVYSDGITVRSVPSRLGRSDRKKETKSELKLDKPLPEKEQKRGESRNKRKKEKEDKRKLESDDQKLNDPDQNDMKSSEKQSKESKHKDASKNETKRYSTRKARQEKSLEECKEATVKCQDESLVTSKPEETLKGKEDIEKKEARLKRQLEKKQADERVQRQIKNKDRPTMQIYQPKRRQETDSKTESLKSSDEFSETNRRRSETNIKAEIREKRIDKKMSKKNLTVEAEKGKALRKNSEESNDSIVEKLEKTKLDAPDSSTYDFKPNEEKEEETFKEPDVSE